MIRAELERLAREFIGKPSPVLGELPMYESEVKRLADTLERTIRLAEARAAQKESGWWVRMLSPEDFRKYRKQLEQRCAELQAAVEQAQGEK